MGTRSRIGILNSNGTVTAVYCHHDGYPSNNGRILLENYTNEIAVRKLLDYGDISALRANIGGRHSFRDEYDIAKNENWCVFFVRDRGEDITECGCKDYESVSELLKFGEEYTYIFNPATNQWFWTTCQNKGDGVLNRLKMKDCE